MLHTIVIRVVFSINLLFPQTHNCNVDKLFGGATTVRKGVRCRETSGREHQTQQLGMLKTYCKVRLFAILQFFSQVPIMIISLNRMFALCPGRYAEYNSWICNRLIRGWPTVTSACLPIFTLINTTLWSLKVALKTSFLLSSSPIKPRFWDGERSTIYTMTHAQQQIHATAANSYHYAALCSLAKRACCAQTCANSLFVGINEVLGIKIHHRARKFQPELVLFHVPSSWIFQLLYLSCIKVWQHYGIIRFLQHTTHYCIL